MRFQLSNPNCCRPRLPKPHCDCPWASVCHWPGQCMGAVNVEIEWKWLKLHVSYTYSNIRNLQFLEPHNLFIFTGTIMIPLEWSRQDWIDCALGFMGLASPFGGLQQDTLEVTYDSKHCWAMAPTRAQSVDRFMNDTFGDTFGDLFHKKKKGDGQWYKMLTKRSGGWVLSEVHPHPGAAAWSLRGLWWWARPANQKPSSGRLGGLQGENEVRKTEKRIIVKL